MVKRKNKKKKKQVVWRVEYTLVILLAICVLAIFSWGFVGALFANIFRLLVGQLYIPFAVLSIVLSLMIIFKVQLPPVKIFVCVGVVLCNIAILLSLNDFQFETNILDTTLSNATSDLFAGQHIKPVGGGLLGGILANIFVMAFSIIGAYFVVALTSIVVLMVLYGKPLTFYADYFKMLFQSFKSRQLEKQFTPQQTQKKDAQSKAFIEDSVDNVVEKEDDFSSNFSDEIPFVINMPTNEKNTEIIEDIETTPLAFSEQEENEDYQLPPLNLLNDVKVSDQSGEYEVIKRNSKLLEETFKSFGVNARVISANLGPSVTKFEVQPAVGVKVSKIVSLVDDIALALAAKDIRIEAPIPGKSYIGIEVPNQSTTTVSFREIIQDNIQSVSKLEVPLGRDISGNICIADLSKMPHLLVAGATGSGKSVAINGMITSILMKAKPNEVKLMMIDPKKVELNVYNGIPHLLTPVVTNPRRAAQALQKVVVEMERRYELFAQTGMRNITGYNEQVDDYNVTADEHMQKLPYIIVIVDELADLMMVASNEVEAAIIRLAQMARAAGIHMVLATQRPSVDVITGLIKANVPSRMAFAVSSSIDSRTIIDSNGAEKLLGKGDMLFMPMGENKPVRVQGAYLSDQEVERIVEFVKTQQEVNYVEEMMPTDDISSVDSGNSSDELFDEIVDFLKEQEFISVSMLQRKFRIGFNRAARLMDELEEKGIVGPAEGTKPRKVKMNNYNA